MSHLSWCGFFFLTLSWKFLADREKVGKSKEMKGPVHDSVEKVTTFLR